MVQIMKTLLVMTIATAAVVSALPSPDAIVPETELSHTASNSGCTDAFEDGTMAKPWDDFDSCATEKSQGACPDGNNPNPKVDAGCQKTCGLCTESGAGDSDCHSCATRFADAGGCTASNPSDHVPSGCGHCGNEAMEECQNRDGSNSGGAGDNSGCTDAFEDGTMAKPWDDFDSCATEKSQGACPDGNNPNPKVDAGCQKTCGLCTESGAGDSDCHSCATRFADAGGCTASNPGNHVPSGCGHCGNEAMEECQNRGHSMGGGVTALIEELWK